MSIHFENKPENPEFPIEFSRVHAGKNHNGAWMNWHINIEILHILEGSGYVLCHGNHIAVTKGDSIIINSNDIHMFYTLNSTCDYIYLIPGVSFCRQIGIDPGIVQFQNLLHDETISSLISSFIVEMKSKSALYTSACSALVATLLIYLYRNYQEPVSRIAANGKSTQNVVHTAILYLQDHYQENISLAQLAQQLGLSLYYLCHLFKKATGFTVIQYVNVLRCNHARALLLSGEYSIAEIANLCGFSDASYFTKQYKKFTGYLPSQTLHGAREGSS